MTEVKDYEVTELILKYQSLSAATKSLCTWALKPSIYAPYATEQEGRELEQLGFGSIEPRPGSRYDRFLFNEAAREAMKHILERKNQWVE